MRVADEFLSCVVFMVANTTEGYKLGGSGFFMSIRLDEDRPETTVFVVTAKHVIDGIKRNSIDGKVWIRLNTHDEGFRTVQSDLAEWVIPDQSDAFRDVAVLPWVPPQDAYNYKSSPIGSLVDDKLIEGWGIGVGDEVAIAGLFVEHAGKEQNRPIVRIGNIAAMPSEPIQTDGGLIRGGYVVEARSISGLSGSPVFVNIGLIRHLDGQTKTLTKPHFALLGLMHGHWAMKVLVPSVSDEKVGINVWLAIVVPSQTIKEALDMPEIKAVVEKARERVRARQMPVMDNLLSP